MWKFVICALALGGCSSDGSGACESAGSRLHPIYRTTTDGLHDFIGWRDTMRSESCAFSQQLDGTWRCLPASTATATSYADAACTQPLVSLPSCGASAYAFESTATDACTTTGNLRPVMGAYSGTQYVKSGTSCAASGAPQTGLFSVGAPIAADQFVAGTIGDPAGTTRLRIRPLSTADGAHQSCTSPAALYDSMRSEDCDVVPDGTGTNTRCIPIPEAAYTNGRFSDAGCTMPAVDAPTCAPTPPKYAIGSAPQMSGSCSIGELRPVYATAGAITSEYQNATGTCAPVTQPSPDPDGHYLAGSQIPDDDFTPLTAAQTAGKARLEPNVNATADGTTVPSGTYRDTMLNTDCTFGTAEDGQLRCLPSQTGYTFYSDAQCKVPILLEFEAPACVATAPTFGTWFDNTVCPAQTHVYSVGPASAQVPIYQLAPTCMLITVPTTLTYYPSTGAAPAAMFDTATDVTE